MAAFEILWIHVTHEAARTAMWLVIAAAFPFMLRSLGDMLVRCIIESVLQQICGMSKTEMSKIIVGKGDTVVTIKKVWDNRYSWSEATEHLGINKCAGFLISVIRLIFWHWMQPLLYWFVLFAYWDLLDNVQQILASIVAGREFIYFCLTCICVCVNPAFLLVDLIASFKEYYMGALIYLFAPEKYIYLSITKNKEGCCLATLFVILCLADLVGMVAFIWAFVVNNVYAPMMVGYSVTTLGGCMIICMRIPYLCCCC
eukprot:550137_1